MGMFDCESIESTYTSLNAILGIERGSLDAIFRDLDIESIYKINSFCEIPPDAMLFSLIMERCNSSMSSIEGICWFHLTRVAGNTFDKGLLPLNMQIDRIWDFLYELTNSTISFAEWSSFKNNLGNNQSAKLYHLKINNSMYWGPYAMLIRDAAFRPHELGNHDYLRIPEIIEDICYCFAERFHIDLLESYITNTRPCIVKFFQNNIELTNDCIKAAFYYLYNIYHAKEFPDLCNMCFDGGGIIPKENILRVEFLT